MSNTPKKKSKWPVPTGTGPVRRMGIFHDTKPRDPTLPMTAGEVLDAPPAAADIGWLWAELPPLREWLNRQSAELEMPLDTDRVVRGVVDAVEAQRPELAGVPPREYLHTLAEKIVIQAV